MPNLNITKNYSDDNELDSSMLDAGFDSVSTFINTTKLDSTNIQSGGIAESNIASNAVTESKIANSSVSTAKIADSAITTVKIADANVTTAKIADANVTLQKLTAVLQTAFCPTGSVLAFAGSSAPTGFLLCDGSPVSRTDYATLYSIIGTSHGQGDGTLTFNLPDYRGRFLRGVTGASSNDPDAASRTSMATGGNAANLVGSVQGDQLASHAHSFTTYGGSTSPGLAGGGDPGGSTGSQGTTSAGGNETRPKNAYVHFIIKI